MRTALKVAPGIGNIDIKAGDDDFSVSFDSKKIDAAKIVECLKAGGEADAAIKT